MIALFSQNHKKYELHSIMNKRTKKNLTETEKSLFRLRKNMPFPTGTKTFKNKKKDLNKKWCRGKK